MPSHITSQQASFSQFETVWTDAVCVFFWTDWTRVAMYGKIFHSTSTCKLVCSATVFEHIDLIWDLFSWLHAHNEGPYAASAEWLCEIQLSMKFRERTPWKCTPVGVPNVQGPIGPMRTTVFWHNASPLCYFCIERVQIAAQRPMFTKPLAKSLKHLFELLYVYESCLTTLTCSSTYVQLSKHEELYIQKNLLFILWHVKQRKSPYII